MTSALSVQPDSGMELRDLLSDPVFPSRHKSHADPHRESTALRRVARVFATDPERVLQEVVEIAVEYCGADSAGISLEEPGVPEPHFRWVAVSGSFRPYLNGTTPRHYSPCGTCVDTDRPQLYRVTQPFYDILGVVADPITDGILIPWISEETRGTLWAVAHRSKEAFDFDDYKLLDSLADFASMAIRYHHNQQALREEEKRRASAARAHRLAHRINNPLQSLVNTIFLASQGGEQAHTHIQQAAKDLTALSETVRNLLDLNYSDMRD